ncbi:MAG: hypothetical protein ACXVHX_15215 [Solirubrobacteraceae bacterium]
MSVLIESQGAAPVALPRVSQTVPHTWRGGLPFVAVTVVARLLIARLPLTPDEGGYLLAASQWHHGTSTYGAYFVDRPPLLMAVFALADLLGGGLALRMIGLLAAALAVAIAGRIGGRYAAAAAALLVITPSFGTTNVDGELLALPLVLGGLYALLVAFAPTTERPSRVAAAAGVLAMAAFLVKQDMVDVFVAAASAGVVFAAGRQWRQAGAVLAGFAGGGAMAATSALGLAWMRGTSPTRLWDALVTFRVQAGSVITAAGAAAGGTSERLHNMLQALALSGAPLVAIAAVIAGGRPVLALIPNRPWGFDLRWAALPVLAWELLGALLGGSYWLHYLIALIPGLVLMIAAAPERPPGAWGRRWVLGTLYITAVSTAVAFAHLLTDSGSPSADAQVSAYLADHRSVGDTVVVGFGHPNVVYGAGMTSPYEYLWSLPARVRDPRLTALTDLMRGPHPPQWIVVAGTSLETWGINAAFADQVLHRSYQLATTAGEWEVFDRR